MQLKKCAILVSIAAFLVCFVGHALAMSYLANTESGKYHKSTCRTIKYPDDPHFIHFDSIEECEEAGYVRCKVCFK